MSPRALLVVAALLASGTSVRSEIGAGAGAPTRSWTIASAVCLAPCEPDAVALIAAQVGRPVEIGPDRLASPLVDPCDGRISHNWTRTTRAAVARSLAGAYGRFDPKLVDLGRGDVIEGVTTCTDARSPNTVARFIMVGDTRAYMLFEGRTLVEMR